MRTLKQSTGARCDKPQSRIFRKGDIAFVGESTERGLSEVAQAITSG